MLRSSYSFKFVCIRSYSCVKPHVGHADPELLQHRLALTTHSSPQPQRIRPSTEQRSRALNADGRADTDITSGKSRNAGEIEYEEAEPAKVQRPVFCAGPPHQNAEPAQQSPTPRQMRYTKSPPLQDPERPEPPPQPVRNNATSK